MAGERTPARFLDLLRVLRDHDVEFVVIGGVAVGYHGYVRGTKDVDIVPDEGRANLTRLWQALETLDARPAELDDFRPEEVPVPWSLEGLIEGRGNWIVATKFGTLHVMHWVKGIESYAALRANAERVDEPEIGGPLWIAGRDDLIGMKEAAGRDIDRIDITAIRMAQGLEE